MNKSQSLQYVWLLLILTCIFELDAAKVKRSPSAGVGQYGSLMSTYNTQYKPHYDGYSILTSYRNNGGYNNDALYSPTLNDRKSISLNSQNRFNQNQNLDSPFDVSYQPNLRIFSNLSPSQSSHNSLMDLSRTILSPNLNRQTNTNDYVTQSFLKNYHNNLNNAAYKNGKPKPNINTNAEESSEWEFDQSAQKPSSNEWEFKGAENSEFISSEKDENREAKELQDIKVPCFSPSCKTWIKITFPEESSIEGGISTTENRKKKITNHRGSVISKPNSSSQGTGSKKSKSALPKPINVIEKIVAASTTKNPPKVTTRKSIASYMFSTSWILSLKRVTVPMPISSSVTVSPISSSNASTSTLKKKTTDLTTSNTAWVKPFTLKPSSKTSEIITAATVVPSLVLNKVNNKTTKESNNKNNIPLPSVERNRKLKPWTHSSSSSSNSLIKNNQKKTKHRPAPTTGATIEEAAIWASSELIEAIREALEKFRNVLNQNGIGNNVFYSEANNELPNQFDSKIQSTWNKFKNGNWIEQTIAKLVMADENLITDKNVSAEKIVSSILPSLLLKLEDDYENAKFKENIGTDNQQNYHFTNKYPQRNRRNIAELKNIKNSSKPNGHKNLKRIDLRHRKNNTVNKNKIY